VYYSPDPQTENNQAEYQFCPVFMMTVEMKTDRFPVKAGDDNDDQ
jgi:hypothetical protein